MKEPKKSTKIIEKYLSTPKMTPYIKVCGGDTDKAIVLYQLNIRLAVSFWTMLNIFEIALRNAIDAVLRAKFGDQWFESLKQLFKTESDKKLQQEAIKEGLQDLHKDYKHDEELNRICREIDSAIKNVKKDINKKKKEEIKKQERNKNKKSDYQLFEIIKEMQNENKIPTLTNDDVIKLHSNEIFVQFSFSFWVNLFNAEPYKHLNEILTVFPNKPNKPENKKRKHIYDMANNIRNFRNKIAHHESIIFVFDKNERKWSIDTEKTRKVWDDLNHLLEYMDIDIYEYSKEANLLHERIIDVERFIEHIPLFLSMNNEDNKNT
ncbi:MAG TPA: Abi family protein [Chitinophagales bacterium]|nr:Abi family protein [Chitinophagales bacterium]